jgi:hypothetical protein
VQADGRNYSAEACGNAVQTATIRLTSKTVAPPIHRNNRRGEFQVIRRGEFQMILDMPPVP